MMADATIEVPAIDYRDLSKALEKAGGNDEALFLTAVNAPFKFQLQTAFMFLGFIVLSLADKKTNTVRRVSYSNTYQADDIKNISSTSFDSLVIPLDHPENLVARTIREGRPHDTTDWRLLLEPAMTAEQARINQAGGGIAYTAVYPLKSRDGGSLSFSYFQYAQNIGDVQRDFMEQYTAIVDKVLSA